MNNINLSPKKLDRSSNKPIRQSNIELLRIIAMFLVLVVHANYFTLGSPTYHEINTMPVSSFTRIFFQSLSILCINVFILISGWFEIKPTFKKFANFIFQCFFFLGGIYVICLCLNIVPFSMDGILGCFCLTPWNWFIKAYILLMIIAPIINVFVNISTKYQVRLVIIGFFIFQSIYGWLNGAVRFFESGCSTMSFIGLYMLARYIKLYPNKYTTQTKKCDFIIFSLIIFTQAVLAFMCVTNPNRIFCYISPLVIFSSIYLLLLFSKLNITSKLINYIAISSFAVFLLHTNPNICQPYFQPAIKYLFLNYSGITCLVLIFIFLVTVFMVSVLVDKLRIMVWNIIWNKFLYKYQ